jgi:spoIIIJ-associated protein
MISELLHVEVAADSLDTAVETALVQLNCSRADADIEVLQVHSGGLLGLFGKCPAKIRASLHDRGQIARQITRHLLWLINFAAEVELHPSSEQINLLLSSEESSRLIGRHGQTLDALQALVASITDRVTTDRTRIVIDVDGYRERRRAFLFQLAGRMTNKVRQTGKSATSPPLNLEERRILHELFRNENGMESCSKNHKGQRKIVILQARG